MRSINYKPLNHCPINPDHYIWTASVIGGVSRFYEGKFTNYTVEDGLSSNNIRSIYVDEEDPSTIWIGTGNYGLNRFRDGIFTFITGKDGLPDHVIHWISQDKAGWLWMSSNRGVFKINKAELNAYLDGTRNTFTLLHFGSKEGMRNSEGNGTFQEAGIRTSDGNFWFATQQGVAIFLNDSVALNHIPPTVLIQNVDAGGKINVGERIVLKSGFKSFDVNFHALTLTAPEKTRFRYRLQGYQDDWTEVFNKRTAAYIDVPAGEYTFEVLASNNDGIWSTQPATASIVVQPFFYEQPWFFLLVILLLGGGYYGASQIRYRYLLRQQEKLEHIIEEQTAQIRKEKNDLEMKNQIIHQQTEELEESNKTKDKFFSLIAHDLRNPFQAILGFGELMLAEVDEADRKDIKSNLEQMHDSSKSLLALVEHLLNWASLHTGKILAKPEPVQLKELFEYTVKILNQVAQQKEIELRTEIESNYTLFADPNMMKTVLRNLVSNALKFTHKGGCVTLKLRKEKVHYMIEVEDNGIGMTDKMTGELLRLDANNSRTGTDNEKGTGLGLLICKEMIAMHHGEIFIESSEGKGTKFTLKLPAKGLSED